MSQTDLLDTPFRIAMRRTVQLTKYHDCLKAFRSRQWGRVLEDGTQHFMGGTLSRIDYPDHATRRRAMNRLTRRDGHRWFRDQTLVPTIPRVLAEQLADRDNQGVARMDLLSFGRRVQIQLGAGLVGLSGVDTRATADELIRVVRRISASINLQYKKGDSTAIVPDALEARREFAHRFYLPSLAEHERIVARYHAGRLGEAELPRDLLTLIALRADPRWEDSELALRESIVILFASVETSTAALTFSFDELENWFETHPDDRRFRLDPAFLLAAAQESLRLHPAAPVHYRRALEEVVLADGTVVHAGELISIRAGIANRDMAIFGPDANDFNPRRSVPPDVNRYGLAFGSGEHLCFGLPIILGAEGVDGSMVHLLRSLYEAGARRDPEHPPKKRLDLERDAFESYPVVLGSL